ncbi:MAG TPA: thioredoxin fold domain-containing protein [Bacteroidia bacterium]|jgi:thioredoxin-related protein
MKRILSVFAVLTLGNAACSLDAQNRAISFEHDKWENVLEKAKKENKLIYLDCFTTWCGPCKWMSKNVFTNDTVADFYNQHFVNVEMDMEKGEGLKLARKYGIRAYPTMLYLNGDGEVIHRKCGSAPAQAFVNTGRSALDPEQQLATFRKKFDSGKYEGGFAGSYFGQLQSACQDYKHELAAYFSTQKESDLASRENWNIIYSYLEDYSSKEFTYLEANREKFSQLYTDDSVLSKISHIYSSGLSTAIRKKDEAVYKTLREKVKASGINNSERILLEADLQYYLKHNEWKEYSVSAITYAEKYAKDDAMQLNALAWNIYENVDDKTVLEKASGWAKHSVELKNMYANLDTYASLLYKLGRKAEARKIAEEAIEAAKKDGSSYSETEDLLKKIGKLN